MQLELNTSESFEQQNELVVLPMLADIAPDRVQGVPDDYREFLTDLPEMADWQGEVGEIAEIFPKNEELARRIFVVGMGKQADWKYESMRRAVSAGVMASLRKVSSLSIWLPNNTPAATLRDLVEIALMATYDFSEYKTQAKKQIVLQKIIFWIPDGVENEAEYREALNNAAVTAEAVKLARDLSNTPANYLSPEDMAIGAQKLVNDNTTVKVIEPQQLEEEGFGGILAVGVGSERTPRLAVIDYHPEGAEKTIGLVGKGVTFDSGGISIKPQVGMDEMKMDMAGAATCLGAVKAAHDLKLPIRVIAVLPLADNMPSGSALKPGDVIKIYGGKTVEVVNTDAEGRLMLADGLAYITENYQLDAVLDVATLTLAAIIALGNEAAAIMGNNDNLIESLKNAGNRTGEKVWELPMWPEYKTAIASDIADMKNMGESGRKAGAIVPALMLSEFVPSDVPWVHLDVAGVAMLDRANSYWPKGGTGWGVRLLVDLIQNWEK